MSAAERLLNAIVDIQHYITHDIDPHKCAACPRWDELQGAAMEAVEEIERLKAAGAWLSLREAVDAARADEREACAKVCDEIANELVTLACDSEAHGADGCSVAIRARGES